jgi:hypothetical protein
MERAEDGDVDVGRERLKEREGIERRKKTEEKREVGQGRGNWQTFSTRTRDSNSSPTRVQCFRDSDSDLDSDSWVRDSDLDSDSRVGDSDSGHPDSDSRGFFWMTFASLFAYLIYTFYFVRCHKMELKYSSAA